ncbi:Neuronal Migration Protein Doublecortin, partial [Manis pentadactyla]
MRWPVLTGGGWEGLGGRWGVRTKGPRAPPQPAPVSASAGRPHLEFIAAAPERGGEEGGATGGLRRRLSPPPSVP